MAPKLVQPARVFTIRRRADGTYVSRNDVPGASPLGVYSNLDMAITSAQRDAACVSRAWHCRVIVRAEGASGALEQIAVIEPPGD